MKRSVKAPRARAYRSPLREEAARRTRLEILEAGRRVLVARGYAAMTMQAVAEEAGVALDTVYASVGRKPKLVALLIETAISGTDQALPPEERDYVQRIQVATTAREKLRIYVAALERILPRLGPVVRAIQGVASTEPELAELWRSIAGRRARNMQLFAEDLLATGELRDGLTVSAVADVLWAMNAPEMYALFVEDRGWSPHEYAVWLADAWERLFCR
jgi:AcrR family transcriptional regulator